MQNQEQIASYCRAIALRFGLSVEVQDDAPIEIVIAGKQIVRVAFDGAAASLAVRTPVTAASRRLSSARLKGLLAKNVPSAETAGASLVASPDTGTLELVHWLGFDDVRPDQLPDLVLNQGAAAFKLNRAIRAGSI